MNVRRHVPALTGLLSVAALALVFAAALRAIPGWLLPRAPDAVLHAIPHVNAVVSLAAIGTILVGVRAIRRGDVARHRRSMLATTGLFALFLVAYLYRVALEGPTEFTGPSAVEQFLYYPVLGIHVLLAIVEILRYAALLSLLVSRELLDLVTEQAADGLVFPPERWAAIFRSHAQLILHELGEYLGYSPPPLLERLIEDAQKIHQQRPILQETLVTATQPRRAS